MIPPKNKIGVRFLKANAFVHNAFYAAEGIPLHTSRRGDRLHSRLFSVHFGAGEIVACSDA